MVWVPGRADWWRDGWMRRRYPFHLVNLGPLMSTQNNWSHAARWSSVSSCLETWTRHVSDDLRITRSVTAGGKVKPTHVRWLARVMTSVSMVQCVMHRVSADNRVTNMTWPTAFKCLKLKCIMLFFNDSGCCITCNSELQWTFFTKPHYRTPDSHFINQKQSTARYRK